MTHLGRILIVDDEPKIRSFIGRALTAAGYATEFAAQRRRGDAQLRRRPGTTWSSWTW